MDGKCNFLVQKISHIMKKTVRNQYTTQLGKKIVKIPTTIASFQHELKGRAATQESYITISSRVRAIFFSTPSYKV